MAANTYRGYLQNPSEMENNHPRYQNTEPNCKPIIYGTLAIMGLLQVASSVAILLHLTGYLHEVDFSSGSSLQQKTLEEVHSAPIFADALRKRERVRCLKNQTDSMAAAHLPIMVPNDNVKKGEIALTTIQWKDSQGHLEKMRYHDGRILVQLPGLYYVYAKTCFRYYVLKEPQDEYLQNGSTQLFQYVYHEKHTQNTIRPIVLMKSGSTKQWRKGVYNMYCEQQSGIFALKEGDGLYVNVSNAWLLDRDPEGTYFGAFKIGN